jgi:hypothetical protein
MGLPLVLLTTLLGIMAWTSACSSGSEVEPERVSASPTNSTQALSQTAIDAQTVLTPDEMDKMKNGWRSDSRLTEETKEELAKAEVRRKKAHRKAQQRASDPHTERRLSTFVQRVRALVADMKVAGASHDEIQMAVHLLKEDHVKQANEVTQ